VLTLLPILSLLLAATIISLIGLLRPRFVYHWLIAVFGALVAWVGLWVMRVRLPLYYGSLENTYLSVPLPTISFQVDNETWPLALAVATLGLAVLLTDVSRAAETSWVIWAGDLSLTAMGVAATLAGNFVTMLLVWTLVDVVELGILFRQVREEERRRRILIFFFTNLLGSMAVVGTFVAAGETGSVIPLDSIPDQVEVYLILAVGLRMGVFPLQISFLSDRHQQRGQGTLLRLIPPAASLSLLVHVSASQSPAGWRTILITFAVLAAVYGAIAWVRAENELRGRLFWIIAMTGMAITAAVQSQQAAAIAWGLAMLYPGALLFLASVRTKRMLPIGIVSVLALTSLPLTPTFSGLWLYQSPQLLLILLPMVQVLLIVGFIRHMMYETEPLTGVEPWVKVVYIFGLGILPLTHYLSTFLGPQISAEGKLPAWPLLVGAGFAVLGAVAYWRKVRIPAEVFIQLDRVFSLRWIDRVIEWFGRVLEQLAAGITLLLEGDGGMLWALVFLAMLVSILGQISGGGGL
jgi:hypothetical protein